jgi:predicted tellurium resistance membrane protein TerC
MFDIFLTSEAWISLLTLTALEVVLGIDNIIFISILAGKVAAKDRDKARQIGLIGAFVSRLGLLATISWIAGLTAPFATVAGYEITGKSLILFVGGLFLLYKATKEIHDKLEGDEHTRNVTGTAKFSSVIIQIILIDIVFSIDSVITAVGMSQSLLIMVLANVIALALMLIASKGISSFVDKHPTVKILALSFLMMIGLVLVADAMTLHIPKGYVYFAMAFSVFTEFVNIRISKKSKPVKLRETPDASALK